ncbi:transposase [Streptomyces corchorusii]|uniref:transposase n=1 Tax=Streptomyces corchorusii TaxID=1903 RepID=UPI003CC56FD6
MPERYGPWAEKGAASPGTRTLPRWPDQQDSPGVRLPGASARLHRHGREHQRLHPVHRRDGRDTGAPPRTGTAPPWPDHVLGDKGYSSKAIRTWLRRRGVGHTIPERSDQIRNRLRRGHRGGRPPAFEHLYKRRNVVERCFNRLKQWRGIATRYDKTAESYQAAITLASLRMWA